VRCQISVTKKRKAASAGPFVKLSGDDLSQIGFVLQNRVSGSLKNHRDLFAFIPIAWQIRAHLALRGLRPRAFAETHSRTTTVLVNEFHASSFQRSAQRSFISERYWNFPVNDLHSTDSCHTDFRGAREVESTPSKQGTSCPHLGARNLLNHALILFT
jgi:hypothetical protein